MKYYKIAWVVGWVLNIIVWCFVHQCLYPWMFPAALLGGFIASGLVAPFGKDFDFDSPLGAQVAFSYIIVICLIAIKTILFLSNTVNWNQQLICF